VSFGQEESNQNKGLSYACWLTEGFFIRSYLHVHLG
jgi:hypothetical protein